MAHDFKIFRSNDNDLRRQITENLEYLGDGLDRIIDYLGAVPPAGIVVEYLWDAGFTGDPQDGHMGANTADVLTVTELRFHENSANGNNIGVIIEAFDPGDLLGIFQVPSPSGTSYFSVTTAAVNQGVYYTMAVEPLNVTGMALPINQDD